MATIHPRFRWKWVLKLIEEIETAIQDAKQQGLHIHSRFHESKSLAINVKVYTLISGPPEMTEKGRERLCEMRQEEFWNWDFDGDYIANTNTYHFPKFWQTGRSGGYFCFDTKCLGSIEELVFTTFDEEVEAALCNDYEWYGSYDWTKPNDGDVKFVRDDIYEVLTNLLTAWKDISEWARVVNKTMEYAIKDADGQHLEYLQNQIDNARYDLFDFSDCTIVIKDGEATVSWPQHARVWDDQGKVVKCRPNTKGGWPRYGTDGKVSGWVKLRPIKKKTPFSFTITVDELVDALAPEVVTARAALTRSK